MSRLFALVLLCLACPFSASATIIGHLEADGVSSLPQSVMDAVGEQRWLFSHASVGANMVQGMQALGNENPMRYQLIFETAGDGNQIYPPPVPTTPGTVYDAARGNPGWAAKFAMFDNAVRNLGWRFSTIDIAMDKLCYIDTDADVSVYLATMTALESSFPATVFIYTAMPLQSGANMDGANILATNYNNAVRSHCAGGSRVLLDIADIESHDPQGNHITFVYQGQTYERMWSGYTSDGGHLNSLGARRVGLGWYATGAAVVNVAGFAPEPSRTAAGGITSIAPNPIAASAEIRFHLGRAGRVWLGLFSAEGRLVASLIDADLPAGDHGSTWNGRDPAGRALPAGVYFARLRSGPMTSVRRLALVRSN